MNIEEKILLYPELPEKERLEVREYVDRHPEWKPTLEEVMELDRVLREAGTFDASAQRDEALAFFATSRNLPHTPPDLDRHYRGIREQLENNPALQERFEELEARRNEIDRLLPPDEQFRRLQERTPLSHSAEPRNVRFLWRAAASIVALAAIYSLLYKIGGLSQPEAERLARFQREELVVEGFETTRRAGEPGSESSATAEYLAALEELGQSERSFIGLFPRFDEARLDSASSHLQRVLEMEPEGTFLAGEAAYLQGKVHLARGELREAESLLQTVVDGHGRRAEEAEAILKKL
ncbi:MAG: hypothetical protein WED81_06625, partial [Rhodothermales bacterium]